MANNKDPAVLFYTSDFLSGCALMDMRERGQYITLLCLQRERGHMTMQEIIRAVKKPSDEVMSKFQKDEDGKYFNRRMELEIEKRDKHCQRQRENISKRWNKENDNSGMADGSACGNTTVLPLGNGNEIEKKVVLFLRRNVRNLYHLRWKMFPHTRRSVESRIWHRNFSTIILPEIGSTERAIPYGTGSRSF